MKNKLPFRFTILLCSLILFAIFLYQQIFFSFSTGVITKVWSQNEFLSFKKEWQLDVIDKTNRIYNINERGLPFYIKYKIGDTVSYGIRHLTNNSQITIIDFRKWYLLFSLIVFLTYIFVQFRKRK